MTVLSGRYRVKNYVPDTSIIFGAKIEYPFTDNPANYWCRFTTRHF